MALLLNGNFFIGQNVSGNGWMGHTNNISQGSYFRPDGMTAAAPTMFGLFAQGSFWFTDNLSINGLYGYLKYNFSTGPAEALLRRSRCSRHATRST